MISFLTCALALSSNAACTSDAQPSADEPRASTGQEIITGAGSIFMWPAGPIAWDGLVGTWPIAIWSPATIGGIAFDIAGVTNLGLTVAGYPGMYPLAITTPYLNAFGFGTTAAAATPGVIGAPFFGTAGLYAPAFGYTGAYAPYAYPGWGYGYGAYSPLYGGAYGTYLNGALGAGWANWLFPTLTTSALMFTNMAALNAFTPYMFNVTFTAQTAAQAAAMTTAATTSAAMGMTMAGLSIFATPILPTALTTATIPFMSMIYPIIPPIL
jgi:hypothetical protein